MPRHSVFGFSMPPAPTGVHEDQLGVDLPSEEGEDRGDRQDKHQEVFAKVS